MKAKIKTVLKLALSVVIVWLVLSGIDERLLLATIRQANFGWLMWAAVWFVVSKVIGAFRFKT